MQTASQILVLAGFMRRLSDEFVQHYPNKIINIHPALLPKYPGLNTYQRALEAGDSEHGTTVHYVTEEIDAGPVIAQARVPIEQNDDIASLMKKTKAAEKKLYADVINQLATHG